MLACTIKGVQNGFPLKIQAEEVVEREADFDPDFLRHIFPKLEWAAFLEGARADESFLKAFHHALLEVHLEEGALLCPETGRAFKVSKGIPNMLLNEDEV
ncbi:hypothetical protein MNEG_0423 [Monoraphidium neglectum]|uniref:Multifunctional methyltransferase subunit TRM112-like protein n=1 Tax=Monoraphidium neglectum TaxID=145388 RepID=A0A0D2LMI6_9CHLO|nr:hypothetical protein MNEG_0423 [Monoraphidium neglectum]KIZ07534.1 hypothetical protein MNEG_0423 [Monoraphidium neglectum]|eukprot:XP_013906553.1 hypothetical protein MNEG_0423 [Monoraphidium neglectum]